MKKMALIIAVFAVVLLIGSFPVRTFLGAEVCDIMRIIGFTLIVIYGFMKVRTGKNSKKYTL